MAEFQLPRPPGLLPTRHSDGGGGLELANILANVLALPQTMENERIKSSQMRATAKAMGVPDDVLDTVAPGEDVPTPVGGTGITGKILSGVGQVGGTLKAILGAPIQAPRFTPTEAKDFEEGAAKESLVGTLDKSDPDYVKKAAKIRLGKYDEVFPGAPKNTIELAQTEADRQGLQGADRYKFIRDQVAQMTGLQTQARISVTDRAKIGQQNEAITQWNKDHPNDQRPLIPMPSDDGGGGGASDTSTPAGGGGGGAGPVPLSQRSLPKPGDAMKAGYISPYDPRFDAAEDKYGHPRGLLRSVAELESGFDPGATGPPIGDTGVQAHGLMQFIPATAAQYGLKDPNDAGASIDAAGRYLKDLRDQNKGDYTAALLQYGGASKSGRYPADEIQKRSAQYRQAMTGQPTGAPTQVAANVPPGSASDVGGPGAIGIPKGSLTDTEGNVYAPNDVTKPLGKVVPNKPGQMIPSKDTLNVGGRTTEEQNPQVKFLSAVDRNEAIAQLTQERAGGANVNPDDEQQIYDRIARNAQGKRGVTEADVAAATVGLKPGETPNPQQARQILEILKNKGGETGPGAALARIQLQRADNALLMAPVPKTDPNTGQALKGPNGEPQYAMWTDPQDGQRKPIRPVDVAMTNWLVAHTPFAAQINIQQMMADPDFHLAAMALNQAQSNLTRWATLKGDAKRIADSERRRMSTMVPQIGDTKQQAIDKLTLGNQALDRM
jgi:hypothetical protein